MDSSINQRLVVFFDSLGISYRSIERELNISNGSLGKLKSGKSISASKLEKITYRYKNLNPYWVLRNEGEMLLSNELSQKETEIPDAGSSSKLLKEIEDLKKDKAILAEQMALKDQQIQRLWKEIDELKSNK
jgi:transcriptional regulator with XRE-family HTH domain